MWIFPEVSSFSLSALLSPGRTRFTSVQWVSDPPLGRPVPWTGLTLLWHLYTTCCNFPSYDWDNNAFVCPSRCATLASQQAGAQSENLRSGGKKTLMRTTTRPSLWASLTTWFRVQRGPLHLWLVLFLHSVTQWLNLLFTSFAYLGVELKSGTLCLCTHIRWCHGANSQ